MKVHCLLNLLELIFLEPSSTRQLGKSCLLEMIQDHTGGVFDSKAVLGSYASHFNQYLTLFCQSSRNCRAPCENVLCTTFSFEMKGQSTISGQMSRSVTDVVCDEN